MGFQGDVAGIGLGELLQGLARGGREGVLTLHGSSLTATIGLQGGQIFLLPEPDEDPELWRRRSERAWVKDPDHRVDSLRMSEIAYAHRLEVLFKLLDAENVHFRFEPGPLPDPRAASPARSGEAEGSEESGGVPRLGPLATGAVHCPGVSVEFLLLEYARLADEGQAHGDSSRISDHDVPRVLDAGSPPAESQRFWRECDGMSNTVEIADRLGWPVRRCKASIAALAAAGALRLGVAREMLVLAQKELSQNRFSRAASRLSGWVDSAEPGPPPTGDVQLLLAEWEKGRLPACLASMSSGSARRLLRRLDLVEQNWKHSIQRWQELRAHHRHDLIAEVRLVAARVRAGDEADAPTVNSLLRLARTLQEGTHPGRAAVVLRVAAQRLPETTSLRLELGSRMLAVGLVSEGAPWILEASRTLIESNLAEKAIAPLRNLIAVQPGSHEARRLLGESRSRSARGRRRRRNSIVALAMLLMFSLVALVQVRVEQEYSSRLGEIQSRLTNPEEALRLLDARFPGDDSERVGSLRETILQRLRAEEDETKGAWLDRYRECQLECTLGDPLLGLRRALDMPDPPELKYVSQIWPPLGDLFTGLAAQLEQTVAEWGEPAEEIPHQEQRLRRLLEDMRAMVAEREATGPIEEFCARLSSIGEGLDQRARVRDGLIHERVRMNLLETQDRLLGSARAHHTAGDLERAVQTYEKLFATEDSDTLRRVLDKEFERVQSEHRSVVRAEELADDGRHEEAIETLRAGLPDPRACLLPWWVRTVPSGGRAHFADGSTRVAPFRMYSTVGERIGMRIELEGHDPTEVKVTTPGDLEVVLSRSPELAWTPEHAVEAPPVAVQGAHVVADRSGRIACLESGGSLRWEHALDSLGGIARAPVFLPHKPGHLLALTEDGAAWLIEGATGRLQGPWEMGSQPVWGPLATAQGVVARFRSGEVALWESRLKPLAGPDLEGSGDPAGREGSEAGLLILRNRAGADRRLASYGGAWAVEIEEEHFRVVPAGKDGEAFAVRREGDWVFAAWEAPRVGVESGRLWISDGAGLRAFRP